MNQRKKNMMIQINKRLSSEIIEHIMEYYNPYKEHYKNQVIYDIERKTLGAWSIYDMRDTIRNYMEHEVVLSDYKLYRNGKLIGKNTGPHINSSIWNDYKFIQGNPTKTVKQLNHYKCS